jgi:hypothetical protein
MSIDQGLVKNVHVVVVVTVGNHLITIHILVEMAGLNSVDMDDILIPCIMFSTELQSGHTLMQKQFPLTPTYASTFNSCQGLTLDHVGVDLMANSTLLCHTSIITNLQLYPGESSITNVTYCRVSIKSACLCDHDTPDETLVLSPCLKNYDKCKISSGVEPSHQYL